MSQLKEYIKSLIRQELEEISTSGDAGGYLTPKAFSPKGQKKNAATAQAEKSGWKKAPGMPKQSKMLDYKELWKGKKSAMNETSKEDIIQTLGKEKYQDLFNLGKEAAKQGKTLSDNPNKGNWNILSKEAWDLGFKSIKTNENMSNNILKNIIREELLNEVTYSKFKNEVKFRTKSEQLHKAIREVKRKLQEIDRIVDYTSRMKQELSEGEEGIKYWKATQKNISTISEMVNHLNNKIKNLHQ